MMPNIHIAPEAYLAGWPCVLQELRQIHAAELGIELDMYYTKYPVDMTWAYALRIGLLSLNEVRHYRKCLQSDIRR